MVSAEVNVACSCRGRNPGCVNCAGAGTVAVPACRRCRGTGRTGGVCMDCRGAGWRTIDLGEPLP